MYRVNSEVKILDINKVRNRSMQKLYQIGHKSNRMQAITQDTAIRNLLSTRAGN